MSSRSPSGVASLRARFESHGEDTSPPSRGRSPAGSVTSSSSRPLSKVRTSFVAVEPSGHMASELGSKGLDGTSEAVTGDNAETSESAVNTMDSEVTGNSNTNDHGANPQDAANPTINVTGEQPTPESAIASKPDKAIGEATSGNPDKPVSTAEDDTAVMLPADPKDAGTVSGGAALAESTPELGSILKGSPFEEKETKKAGTSKSSKTPAAAAITQGPKAQKKAPSAGPANDKPKEAQMAKPTSTQPPKSQDKAPVVGNTNGKPRETQMTKPTSTQSPKTQEKAPIVGNTNGKAKEAQAVKSAPGSEPKAAPPAPIETQSAATSAPSAAPESSEYKNDDTAPPALRTPTSATAAHEQPLSEAPSPAKPVPPQESQKDVAKEAKKPASRPSAVSKPPTAAAPKPISVSTSTTAKSVKKPGPTSPAFTKPKPKSPTRPVRLPASATAPTAASAAKLDGAPPSMSDRRTMNMASVTRDRTPSNPRPAGQKTSRASLPAGSKPADKPKAPKTRMSMASTQAPPGSFLERMTRPTQSSAQKTHEKVEPKLFPKKSQSIRPKRTSEGSEKSKSEQGETKAEQSQEIEVGTNDVLNTNGANETTDEAHSTVPAEIPAQ